jgi:hypothetical protein
VLWYVLIITTVAGILADPMWFVATGLAVVVACLGLLLRQE